MHCVGLRGNPAQFNWSNTMYRVFIPNLNRWIENIPVTEALVYKEEGYRVERMS